MSGPYTKPQCADCDQYADEFCNISGLCSTCCGKCYEGEECDE